MTKEKTTNDTGVDFAEMATESHQSTLIIYKDLYEQSWETSRSILISDLLVFVMEHPNLDAKMMLEWIQKENSKNKKV